MAGLAAGLSFRWDKCPILIVAVECPLVQHDEAEGWCRASDFADALGGGAFLRIGIEAPAIVAKGREDLFGFGSGVGHPIGSSVRSFVA